jgi:isoleucyl-tRNA synthetase
VELGRDDLDVRVEGRSGFALAQDGPLGVALDLELTPELRAEGVAREVVRSVQDLRKSAGLAVEDRVRLWATSASVPLLDALRAHESYIASEVLAVSTLFEDPPDDAARTDVELEGGSVRAGLVRAERT